MCTLCICTDKRIVLWSFSRVWCMCIYSFQPNVCSNWHIQFSRVLHLIVSAWTEFLLVCGLLLIEYLRFSVKSVSLSLCVYLSTLLFDVCFFSLLLLLSLLFLISMVAQWAWVWVLYFYRVTFWEVKFRSDRFSSETTAVEHCLRYNFIKPSMWRRLCHLKWHSFYYNCLSVHYPRMLAKKKEDNNNNDINSDKSMEKWMKSISFEQKTKREKAKFSCTLIRYNITKTIKYLLQWNWF